MTCKGICVRYKAQKPVGTGRYASGQRRCQICEIFIKWEGLWCPCCGYRLRTKPRNLKYKAKLLERVEADSIEAKSVADTQNEESAIVVKTKTRSKAKVKTAKSKITTKRKNHKDLPVIIMDDVEYNPSKIIETAVRKNVEPDIVKQENPPFVEIEKNQISVNTNYMDLNVFYPLKYKNGNYAVKKNSKGTIEFVEIIQDNPNLEIEINEPQKIKVKAKKITKTKEKTPCQYCEKLFVYVDKHEIKCKKNPHLKIQEQSNAESIVIKAGS